MSATASTNQGLSDILDEQVDSSGVLIGRLETWKHAVSVVHNYAQSVLHAQNNITSDLAKQSKIVSEVPNFNASGVAGSAVAGAQSPGASNAGPGGSGISIAYEALVKQVRAQLQQSEKAAASIKSSILPQLEILETDVEKHHKTLRSESHRLTKEAEKHRENTANHLENLGRAVPAAQRSGQKPDPKHDPYVLHRQVRSAAATQIHKENQLAGSNVNVQNNFGSFEQHVIEVLQGAIASLTDLAQQNSQVNAQTSANTEQQFASIEPSQEWGLFTKSNSKLLVPQSGYERDPSKVTFANADAPATVPVIEGVLDRRGTVLKGHKPGYYVLTASGFLHQFKSANYVADTHPELSLYIPESEISGLPAANSGDLSFRIVSRDFNKPISPHHKYTFTASSYEELVAWHNALAKVAGATASNTTLENAEEDPGIIPSAGGAGSQESSPRTESVGVNYPLAGNSGASSGLAANNASSAQQQGLQHNIASQQQPQLAQPAQAGLGQTVPQAAGGPQSLQQQGSLGAGQFVGAGNTQRDLSQGVGQLNLGGPQQAQSGLQHDINQFASGPQQVQSGLRNDINQFASAPQQVQSGLRNDINQFASGPQQIRSDVGQDINQLRSVPQQVQSGVQNDVKQFTSGPQQVKSDVSGEINDLKNAPQQFQSGLKDDVNQFTSGFK